MGRGSQALGPLVNTLWARAYVGDPAAAGGTAVTPAASFTLFGPSPDAIFAADFESGARSKN
ncbi:MAG TPA: hypothetical protein VN259_17010 [Xanthomonadales bacterium]|nr:hypothetical protein [Xanthomonadales bacterium]